MATCETCGNDYDKAFTLTLAGESSGRVFDSFECAIQGVAPVCGHCGVRILGHGAEVDGKFFCCAHCAERAGHDEMRDRSGGSEAHGSDQSQAGASGTTGTGGLSDSPVTGPS